MKDSVIYVFVFIALQLVAGWIFAGETQDVTTTNLVVMMTVFSVSVIGVFLLAGWAVVSPRWLLTRPWGVLVWSVIAAWGMMIPETWLMERMPELPNWMEREQELLMSDYWGYLAIGLLAPFAEEIVFRGAVLRSLLGSMRAGSAIVVSALFFSIVHMNPAQMPFAFLAGLLLGWMYWRTGSILPGMAYHWANNSAAYVLYRAYPDPDIKLVDLFKGSELHVYLAVFFSLLILLPALYQLHLWMRRAE